MTTQTVAAGFGLILIAVGVFLVGWIRLIRDDRRDAADQAEKAEEFGPDGDECTWCDGTGLVKRLQMGVEVYITCGACRGHGAIFDDGRHLLDTDDEVYDLEREQSRGWGGGDAA